jgi:dihydroflavonol-4-reductase
VTGPDAAGPPVLVTGATGFVGGLVAARLLADGRHVRALVRRPQDAARLSPWGPAGPPPGAEGAGGPAAPGRLEPVVGDLADPESLARAADGAEVAYHVAGLNTLCLPDPSRFAQVNVTGTANLLAAARLAGLRRVVVTSSAATLGSQLPLAQRKRGDEAAASEAQAREPADERAGPPERFTSHYARSKYEAELLALAFEGVEVVAVNPSSVQGPGRRTGTAKLFLDYLNGRLPFVVPAEFGLCYADDCAAGHLLAEAKGEPGQRYVLNGATLTTRQALDLVGRLAGLDERPRTLPVPVAWSLAAVAELAARARGRQPRLCRETVRTLTGPHRYDGGRAARELGLAYTPVEVALERTVRWYQRQGLVTRPLPALA